MIIAYFNKKVAKIGDSVDLLMLFMYTLLNNLILESQSRFRNASFGGYILPESRS